MSNAQPTLRSVAEAAGVSAMTVSRALRNHPEVSQTTRDRIRALAARLGYRPDPFVSRAMTRMRARPEQRGAEPLAVIWPHAATSEVRRNPRRIRMMEGIYGRAALLGMAVQEHETDGTPGHAARLSRRLYNRGVSALLLLPFSPHRSTSLAIEWDRFAAATMGFGPMVDQLHRGTHDHFGGMTLALERLASRGRRRVAALLTGEIDEFVHRRYSAAFLTHAPQGTVAAVRSIYTGAGDPAEVVAWLRAGRFDAVVSNIPFSLPILRDAGLPVPERLSFVCLHWSESEAAFAGIDQMPERIAEVAVDLVFGQLNRNESGLPASPRTVLVPGEWRSGTTL
jgi:DNA-binding LacI/PurR family transcriptional regulator